MVVVGASHYIVQKDVLIEAFGEPEYYSKTHL